MSTCEEKLRTANRRLQAAADKLYEENVTLRARLTKVVAMLNGEEMCWHEQA